MSLLHAPTASPFTMIWRKLWAECAELDPVATGEQTAVPSGSARVNEGLFVPREESDSEEMRAQRGEGPGLDIRRRSSRRSETRSETLRGK